MIDVMSLSPSQRQLLTPIRAALMPFGASIQQAFIFGSMASGTDRPDSDVDLMVIGDASLADLYMATGDIQKEAGRPMHINTHTIAEWESLQSDPIIQAILEQPHITVLSNPESNV